jgi:hypothetical protein
VNGKCGFALLGEDLQSGEAEFVEVNYDAKTSAGEHLYGSDCEMEAAREAFEALKKRLKRTDLSFYFGRSHPYGN